jgi:hypothetical protein
MKFLVMTHGWPGHWGRGNTVLEAVRNGKWFKTKEEVTVFISNDPQVYVDEMGCIFYRAEYFLEQLGVGKVRANGAVNLTLE